MTRVRRLGTVVLTGATSGIGEATASMLASRAETLILLGSEPENAIGPVLDQIRISATATIHYLSADFARLGEVVGVSRAINRLAPRIDLLINNAAVPGAPAQMLTADGFERTLQVNALAPALLTRLLVPSLADGARIVNVGSSAHRIERFDFDDIDLRRAYSPVMAYARAKLAMVTWSALLAKELAGIPADVVSLCPGLNDTALSAAMTGGIGGPPSIGAARVLHASIGNYATGSYLENDRAADPDSETLDPRNRARLTRLYVDRLAPFTPSELRDGDGVRS